MYDVALIKPGIQFLQERVLGNLIDGNRQLLSISDAGPPVRALRFALLQPPPPWRGVRNAVISAPDYPARLHPFAGLDVQPLVNGGQPSRDDYQTLNILAPDNGARYPALVWIHSDGFVVESKDALITDGIAFTRDSIDCVEINYRRGVSVSPIDGVPTNFGLRNMRAAPAWVRGNTKTFGGDQDNIAVADESTEVAWNA